jgi:7-keto-8-aminopelargonate synthetase-like enzyme
MQLQRGSLCTALNNRENALVADMQGHTSLTEAARSSGAACFGPGI